MFKTHEISIGVIFRLFIGARGILVVVIGFSLSVREIWYAFQGEWLRLVSAFLFS
jgi:hypothetical protein